MPVKSLGVFLLLVENVIFQPSFKFLLRMHLHGVAPWWCPQLIICISDLAFFFFFKKQKHNFLARTGSSYNKQHLTWSLIYFVLFPPLCDRVVGLGSLCLLSYLLASHPCWVLGFTWQLRRWISVTGWDLALPQTRAGTCYLPLSMREASVLWLARKCFCAV